MSEEQSRQRMLSLCGWKGIAHAYLLTALPSPCHSPLACSFLFQLYPPSHKQLSFNTPIIHRFMTLTFLNWIHMQSLNSKHATPKPDRRYQTRFSQWKLGRVKKHDDRRRKNSRWRSGDPKERIEGTTWEEIGSMEQASGATAMRPGRQKEWVLSRSLMRIPVILL